MGDVERIKEYIRAGDCFQALLARRIRVPHDFDSSALYRALRALNPSPYMYHLVLDGVELVGCSPELTGARRGRPRHRAPDRRHAPRAARRRPRTTRWRTSCSPTRRSAPST